MEYTKIPETAFAELQLNAGILVSSFNPTSGEATGLIGATTGGISVSAIPSFEDFGDDIDNCPKNMKELKKLTSWEIKMSGTILSVSSSTIKKLSGAADVASNKVTLRNDLESTDFSDIWWVGDYSDHNTTSGSTNTAGFIAVHMKNALSTGGFSLKTADKAKGQFSFEFTAHYAMTAQNEVPCEIFVKAGT